MSFAPLRTLSLASASLLLATSPWAKVNDALVPAALSDVEAVSERPTACRTVEQGDKPILGRNNCVSAGGAVAAVDISQRPGAVVEYGSGWPIEPRDAFPAQLRGKVDGVQISFAGRREAQDWSSLLGYINTDMGAPLALNRINAAASNVAEEEYEFGVLFDASGVEATYYACTACHSEMIVAQQGLTRDGWDEMLQWMVEEQGMSEIDEPERSEILDYLAQHYNTDRPNFPTPQRQN